MLLLVGLAFAAPAAEPDAVDPGEAAQHERLVQAQQLVGTGRHDEALALIEQTLDHYAQRYPAGTTRWYVARTPEEALLYMAGAATEAPSAGRNEAKALAVLWAEAHYMKGYALFELDQLDAARASLEQALQLSPRNARFLSELGNLHQHRREWDEARRRYEAAEAAAQFSPAEDRVKDLTRAKRGIGFVLIEQGELDAAEAKFRECLALDRDDRGAQNELTYIEHLRQAAPAPAGR